jgi:hypothetical protein
MSLPIVQQPPAAKREGPAREAAANVAEKARGDKRTCCFVKLEAFAGKILWLQMVCRLN